MDNFKKECIAEMLKYITKKEHIDYIMHTVEFAYKEERGVSNE